MPDVEMQQVGRAMTTALVVGGMIGAGIVLLPISLAPLGLNAVIGWLVSGVGVLCLAYALAIVSGQDGQGIQAYIERQLGVEVGFAITWAFWTSIWTSSAALAIAAASASSLLIPGGLNDWQVAMTAIGMIAFLQLVNAFGVRAAGGTAILTVLIKILPLIAVIGIALVQGVSGKPFVPLAPLPVTFDNIATASAFTLFALLGFETATAPVGKVRDPARTVPFAIMAGTIFVAVLYLFSTTAISLILPGSEIVNSRAPFATAVGSAMGSGPAMFAAFAMAVSAFGCLNGAILVGGELGYSMALRRDLPTALSVTSANGTPLRSQILVSGLAIALVGMNMSRSTASLFEFLILLTASVTLWLYLSGLIAAIKMRRSALAIIAVIVGTLFVVFAFYGSGMEANVWGVALIAAGFALRWLVRRTVGSIPSAVETPA